jgi:hypothetical protein
MGSRREFRGDPENFRYRAGLDEGPRVNPDPRKAKPRQYIRGEASTHAGDRLIAAQE